MKSVRVTILTDIVLDDKANGIAAYLRSFLRNATGVTCKVWTPRNDQSRIATLASSRGSERESWITKRLPARIRDSVRLWGDRLKLAQESDVLFVHQNDFVIPFLFGNKWPPIVVVMHGWNPPEIASVRGWKLYLWLRLIDWLAVRKAAAVIMVSHEGLRGFQRRYPQHGGKLVHIPTFMDDEFVHGICMSRRAAADCMSEDPILLSVARLVPEKQIDRIIHVYARVRKAYPKARLILIGDGSERNNLESVARNLGVEDGVQFEGSVPHEGMGQYLGLADFFLLLSKWEGTSIALLEAMACGLPVIVTDIADHARIVDSGIPGLVIKNAFETECAASWIISTFKSRATGGRSWGAVDRRYLASTQVPEICRILRAKCS